MKISEFDSTSIGTGIKNYLSGRRDLALKNAGSGDAHGRLTIRLIANKMYKQWRYYLGSQHRQPTNQEMAAYIGQNYGANRLQQLGQTFPSLAAFATLAPAATQPSQSVATPTAPPVTPAQPAPVTDDHATMVSFQNYQKQINQLLRAPTMPNASQVMTLIAKMAQDVATKGAKPRAWFQNYISQLKMNSLVMHAVPQLAKIDDTWFTPQPASPPTSPQPPPTANAPNDLTIPQPPNNATVSGTPPAFLRRPQSEAAQPKRARPPPTWANAPDNLTIPRPPGTPPPVPAFLQRQQSAQPQPPQPQPQPQPPQPPQPPTWANAPDDLTIPRPPGTPPPVPAFLQRQRSSPPTVTVLKRAEMDKIFVALARIVSASGDASVTYA